MSHEIRTPMNAMIGFTHLLAETELKDEQKEYITRIQDSSKHLLSIINDILDLSKMEAGKMTIENRRFAIDQMLQEVKDLFSEQAKRKHLYMDFETIHCPNYVIGDAIRIKQILINLISNALKFTDIGGLSIFISSQFKDPHTALVSFRVKDTGIGMSQAQQDKLFKEYEQASSSTTRLFGGTGLGLSISMRLAKLMHGDISVESKLNEGSTFTLILPLKLDEREDDVLEDQVIIKNYRKHARILVAEDHVLSQKLVERLLTNLEEDVLIVDNGEQALQAMKEHVFDLVFLDMNMPLLDGISATKSIRRFNTKTPIVALTANAYPEERSQCLLAGMNDVLVKPIDSKSLQEALVKWIPEE
jgi:CheY-like chemotaxis protein